MDHFELVSKYQPTGDQPEAITQLTEGVNLGLREQTLLGVTGSGKTFTMANIIVIITSRKRISPVPIPILKRIPPSMTRSINCAIPPPARFPSGGM